VSHDINSQELKLASSVANRIGRRWELVDVDDVTGHLYLWLVQNRATVARWRGEDGGEGKLYVSLRREAAKYCANESSARINRPINDSPAYSPELLERALPFVFEDTPVTEVRVNPVTGEALDSPGESGLAQAIMADIRGAFYGLPAEIREVLAWRYRDGLTYEEIGELSNMTKDGSRRRVARGLRRLSDALGTEILL
jgi:RNA polymerase sigma factor (sigma-70 family)